MSYNTTAPTFAAGEVVTATKLNALADGIQSAWTSYSPTWTASTVNPTIGGGTLVGAYMRVGKTFHYRINLTIGSGTTVGTGNWIWALPAAANAAYTVNMHLGNGIALDTSVPALTGLTLVQVTSTTVAAITSAGSFVGNATPYTWAIGDKLGFSGTYEAA